VDNMSDSVRAGEEDTPAPAPDEDRAAGAGLFDLITALTARHAGARRNAGTA
jgi:hypothetical protein